MKRYLLHALIVSFVFFLMPDIHSAEEPYITIRSSYTNISVSQERLMHNIVMSRGHENGMFAHSTINHSYEKKHIDEDGVVIDHTTGLMWHQSGSSKYMKYKKSKEWLEGLNRNGYAGYHDWRLPTVEEATSLLESSKREGRYIDQPLVIDNVGS